MKVHSTAKPITFSPEEKAKSLVLAKRVLARISPRSSAKTENARGRFVTLTPADAWAAGAGR